MEWGRQLRIDHVRLGACALDQDHEHLVVAKERSHVQHRLALGVVHILRLDIVELEELVSCSLVVVLDGLPERVVHTLLVAEVGAVLVADVLVAAAFLGAQVGLDLEVLFVFDGRILYDLVIV